MNEQLRDKEMEKCFNRAVGSTKIKRDGGVFVVSTEELKRFFKEGFNSGMSFYQWVYNEK